MGMATSTRPLEVAYVLGETQALDWSNVPHLHVVTTLPELVEDLESRDHACDSPVLLVTPETLAALDAVR
jgi:hypothetical protein